MLWEILSADTAHPTLLIGFLGFFFFLWLETTFSSLKQQLMKKPLTSSRRSFSAPSLEISMCPTHVLVCV